MLIFPSLCPHFLDVFEQAQPCNEYVITPYRSREANLGTQLKWIVTLAGLTPWPLHAEPSQTLPAYAKANTQNIVNAGLDAIRQESTIPGNAVQNPKNGPGGTRTLTPLREMDFESIASANSATGPWWDA